MAQLVLPTDYNSPISTPPSSMQPYVSTYRIVVYVVFVLGPNYISRSIAGEQVESRYFVTTAEKGHGDYSEVPNKRVYPLKSTMHHLDERFQQHFSIISKFLCCGFYMKRNVAFKLITFAVLK